MHVYQEEQWKSSGGPSRGAACFVQGQRLRLGGKHKLPSFPCEKELGSQNQRGAVCSGPLWTLPAQHPLPLQRSLLPHCLWQTSPFLSSNHVVELEMWCLRSLQPQGLKYNSRAVNQSITSFQVMINPKTIKGNDMRFNFKAFVGIDGKENISFCRP